MLPGREAAALPSTAKRPPSSRPRRRCCAKTNSALGADAVNQALSARGLCAGLYQAEDGVLDPVRLTRGLLGIACAAGAELRSGQEVHAIDSGGDHVQVRSHSGCFHAERVLICTNAWGPQLLPWLERWVVPVRGQVLALDGTRGRLRWPVYADHGYAYVRQVGDGRVVAGGMRHRFVDEEVGYGDATTAGLQSAIEAFLAEYFPELAGGRVTHRWSGTMALSPDGVPLLTRAPDEPRLTFLGGFSGHGLGFAFHLAKLAVAHALDGVPAEPFELTRFEAGP